MDTWYNSGHRAYAKAHPDRVLDAQSPRHPRAYSHSSPSIDSDSDFMECSSEMDSDQPAKPSNLQPRPTVEAPLRNPLCAHPATASTKAQQMPASMDTETDSHDADISDTETIGTNRLSGNAFVHNPEPEAIGDIEEATPIALQRRSTAERSQFNVPPVSDPTNSMPQDGFMKNIDRDGQVSGATHVEPRELANVNPQHTIADGANQRASTSSRPISDDFFKQYREYLAPADCVVGRSGNGSSMPSFIKPNSRKADYILGVHIMSMQALAALEDDSDDSPTAGDHGNTVEVHGGDASPSKVSGIPRRNHSIIKPTGAFAEEQVEAPRITAMPRDQRNSAASRISQHKRVSLVTPPLDPFTDEKRHMDIIRTPYPFKERSSVQFPKVAIQNASTSPANFGDIQEPDSVLTLSIGRRYAHSSRLVSRILIPALSDFPGKASETSEKHFLSLDFDDATFFKYLRREYYHKLLGHSVFSRYWRRWLSARVLKRIALVAATSVAEEVEDNGLSAIQRFGNLRSPRYLARKGLSDTFSEERLLHHFKHPREGSARYSWVHWAHRVAAHSYVEDRCTGTHEADQERGRTRLRESVSRSSRGRNLSHSEGDFMPSGLEFVEGWSPWRIIGAVALVILASSAAVLLWVFLGPASPGNAWTIATSGNSQSMNDAARRVGGGLLLGGLVMIFGCIVLVGWLVVSWIWMS